MKLQASQTVRVVQTVRVELWVLKTRDHVLYNYVQCFRNKQELGDLRSQEEKKHQFSWKMSSVHNNVSETVNKKLFVSIRENGCSQRSALFLESL